MAAALTGLEFLESPNKTIIQLHNPRAVAAAIGEATLVAFYRCFIGIERLLAFEHLIMLNKRARETPQEFPVDTHAFHRNTRLLSMLLTGTLHEFGAALQALCATGVVNRIGPDRSSWEPLNTIRKQWNKHPFASRIRNTFAHHLGEIDDFRKGLAAPDAPKRAVLFAAEVPGRLAGHVHEPTACLERALGMTEQTYIDLANRAINAHIPLPELVLRFFRVVLQAAGIDVRQTTVRDDEITSEPLPEI